MNLVKRVSDMVMGHMDGFSRICVEDDATTSGWIYVSHQRHAECGANSVKYILDIPLADT